MLNLNFAKMNYKVQYNNLIESPIFEEQIWTIIYLEEEEKKYFDLSKKKFNLELKPGEYNIKFLVNSSASVKQIMISKKISLKDNQNYRIFIENDWKDSLKINPEMIKARKIFKKYYKLIIISLIITLLLTNAVAVLILIVPSSLLYAFLQIRYLIKTFNKIMFQKPESLNIVLKGEK